MYHVRPYKVFTLLEEAPSERVAHVSIPSRRGLGGVSLLETFLLITIAKVVSASRLFEIGTFLGNTTLNLALNTPAEARIFTLDLDPNSAQKLVQDPHDSPLTSIHLSQGQLDFSSAPMARKIEILLGNSISFDFSSWYDSIDFVFIDGGHDRRTLLADTNNALRMARHDRVSCVLWHDYGNPEYDELTCCLDELSQEIEMFHVNDSQLCFSFQGPGDDLSRLKHHLLNSDLS
jgi:Methyltransferase domain